MKDRRKPKDQWKKRPLIHRRSEEEQRKLVEEHVGNAEITARRWARKSGLDWGELHSPAYDGLCVAARLWDESRQCFRNYAMSVMDWRIIRFLKKRRQDQPRVFSEFGNTGDDNRDFASLIEDHRKPEIDPETNPVLVALREAISRLPLWERIIIDMVHCKGMTLADAAREIGVTRERCRQLADAGIVRLKKMVNAGEVKLDDEP